jgi:hypothetical protein
MDKLFMIDRRSLGIGHLHLIFRGMGGNPPAIRPTSGPDRETRKAVDLALFPGRIAARPGEAMQQESPIVLLYYMWFRIASTQPPKKVF